jgi:predicted HTH domain antitoxin
MMPLAALGVASPALAKEPTGAFAVFKHCPLKVPATESCIYAQTKSGEFKIKTTAVPIVNTITLQGGLPETGGDETPIPPEGVEALSKTPQPVPGGLLNIIKCKEIKNFFARVACELFFEKGALGVNATAELVGFPIVNQQNLLFQEGIGLTLPLRIHLENAFLGNECYVGSPTKPVTLKLTSGTTSPPKPNEPISGSGGTPTFSEEGNLLTVTGNSAVDNSYSVPEASGCGGLLSIFVNPIVNAKLGLPSVSGNNTAILNSTLEVATREGVEKSEK